ncbi:MAG: hypothetical protein JNL97_15245 [Verrucomicrobiales bacterium]|nr:hypothetical protein [Verrucomicrobiales bacterium]
MNRSVMRDEVRGDTRGLPAARPSRLRRATRLGLVLSWVFSGVAGMSEEPAPPTLPASESSPSPAVAPTAASESVPPDPGIPDGLPSVWNGSLTLRVWSGYRDNPMLSAVRPVGSAFMAAGVEGIGFRLPIDGWEATAFGLFERLEYFEAELSPETTGVLDVRGKRTWGDGWFVGAALEYYYLKQVFDASEIVGVRVIIPTEGHTLSLRPTVGRELGGGWRWEVEPEFSRQWLREPLDGFLDVGTRVQAVKTLGKGSEWGVSYRYRDRGFDERVVRDAAGGAGTDSLEYSQHEAETFWRAVWDEKRRWRTTLRGGYANSADNGSGYFDYERFQCAGQVRHSRERWEVRAEVKARWYRYPVQRAYQPDGPMRRRVDASCLVRGDWKLGGGWRIFGQYELDLSDENMTAADYRSTGWSLGVEWEP